jgi:nucleoside-diphosphate-sugar epimerase
VPLKQFPADESHEWRIENHVNFHGKIANDKHALELFAKQNFPITIFRPTNIIGDGRVPLDLYGGRDVNFFKALRNNETLELPDCRQIMLQSVCNWDLAKAMNLALTATEEIRGEIIILSTNYSIRLIDYLNIVKEHLNSTSEIQWIDSDEFLAAHPEHTGLKFLREHMCFSIDKARRLLGYEPDYTPEQGLKKSLQWCTDNQVF